MILIIMRILERVDGTDGWNCSLKRRKGDDIGLMRRVNGK